jgi:hypothetical protein
MKLALPDLHGDVGRLDSIAAQLSGVDLVLLVGDITNGGGAGYYDADCFRLPSTTCSDAQ